MRSSALGFSFALTALAFAAGSSGKDDLPISVGEYQIRLGGERIGQEQFRVFKDKSYVIESTRTLYWPEPSRREMRYELEPTLEPKKLTLSVTRAGIVTELKLERQGENWRVETEGQDRDKKKHTLGRRSGTVVDFDSLVFNAVALRRLGLGAGEERSVEAITLALPDLAGARAKQTYRRLPDEELKTEFAGTIQASVYELAAGEATHRIWVAPSGAVLKAELDTVGGDQEVLLVRLTTPPGAWPP
jgi:hypothetical protein